MKRKHTDRLGLAEDHARVLTFLYDVESREAQGKPLTDLQREYVEVAKRYRDGDITHYTPLLIQALMNHLRRGEN